MMFFPLDVYEVVDIDENLINFLPANILFDITIDVIAMRKTLTIQSRKSKDFKFTEKSSFNTILVFMTSCEGSYKGGKICW